MSKILLDVDGVVADMVGELFDRLGGDLKKEDYPNWDLLEDLPEEKKKRAYKILSKPDFWAQLPLVDKAKKAVKHLKDFGHEVVWITAPWTSCPKWDEVRTDWVKRHFGNDNVIVTADKAKEKGDVFIDDRPSNVEEYKKAHPSAKVFIFDTPHNRDYAGAPRFTWDDVGILT